MTLQGLRVLIAEDETLIRLDLRQMLEEHGIEVCGEARDGLEAVELARRAATRPRGLRPEDAEPGRCRGRTARVRGAAAADRHADCLLRPKDGRACRRCRRLLLPVEAVRPAGPDPCDPSCGCTPRRLVGRSSRGGEARGPDRGRGHLAQRSRLAPARASEARWVNRRRRGGGMRPPPRPRPGRS